VPIAEREVLFYLKIAEQLKTKNANFNIVFASLYQPGDQMIRQAGFKVFSTYEFVKKVDHLDAQAIASIENQFNIDNLHRLILHEKLTFNIWDDSVLHKKFISYLFAAESVLQQIKKAFPAKEYLLVQELGGFIGPLSFYYASRKLDFAHYFTEPAFFKGRIHFNLNSLDTIILPFAAKDEKINQQVQRYLQNSLKNKVVVAAAKDRHHFQDMRLLKILNLRNIIKFSKKIIYKYIYGYKQEYEHVLNHTLRSLQMYKNRLLNSKIYTKKLSSIQSPYFYFPFHVQLDYSLTVRSTEYLDQLGLCEKIVQRLPAGTLLVVKEHPASIGCLNQQKLQQLLKYNNFCIMHPQLNSYDIIEKATGNYYQL